MPEALVINTGPLIALAKAELLDSIGQLSLSICCPREVVAEFDAGVQRGLPGTRPQWLTVETLSSPLNPVAVASLDLGEAAVIQLALEKEISTVCIDERRGRRAATSVGLRVVGTLGLLLRAKQVGVLPALAPAIDRLQEVGYWYAPDLVRRVLESTGEA